MSKSNESQRLLRSHAVDKTEDDELFVKLPKFSKRVRGKNSVERPMEDSPADERLYNFLKQPLNQRWFWCEFVESFIDKAVLSSGYDMRWYLDNIYPQLQTNKLPLRCWQIVRRNMGKARRFSPAFIRDQLRDLSHDREIVRLLQKRKVDMDSFDMPMSVMPKFIPMQLPMDTKVISLLTSPIELLYKGRVVGYDPKNNSYMIKFDIAGKHIVLSMADHLLYVVHECKAEALADIIQDSKETSIVSKADTSNLEKQPMPLVDALVQLNKLIGVKRKTVHDMAGMNEELEATGTQTKPTPHREKLQRRYAGNMIALHSVNADIVESLHVSHNHLQQLEQDDKSLPSSKIYEKATLLADMDLKASPGYPNLKSQGTRNLIQRLQTLLYLFADLGQGNDTNVNAVLNDFVASITSELPPQLHLDFNNVLGLLNSLRGQMGANDNAESEQSQEQQAETTSFNPSEDLDNDQDL